jgi:hypothetical protein
MTTMAAIDRVVHYCVIVDMIAAESYRAKEATISTRQATTIPAEVKAQTSTNEQETSPVTSENGAR